MENNKSLYYKELYETFFFSFTLAGVFTTTRGSIFIYCQRMMLLRITSYRDIQKQPKFSINERRRFDCVMANLIM